MPEIIIGTRSSQLAISQSQLVADKLASLFPDYEFKLKEITTTGDRIVDKQLTEVGGKGLFIKEIEVALLQEEIDLAVHSLKDMPAQEDNGLEIIAIPKRANPLDALITPQDRTIDQLPAGAKLGTGSLRRKAQLLNYRPDLEIEPLRGNIDTRLEKLANQDLDGIILAVAGLERMGWENKISQHLPPEISIPAAGQGALALQTRADDERIKNLITEVNHQPSVDAVQAERGFLDYLDGDCKVPIGAYAQVEEDKLVLEGMVANREGTKLLQEELTGTRSQTRQLGIKLAKKLAAQGAVEILEQVKGEE